MSLAATKQAKRGTKAAAFAVFGHPRLRDIGGEFIFVSRSPQVFHVSTGFPQRPTGAPPTSARQTALALPRSRPRWSRCVHGAAPSWLGGAFSASVAAAAARSAASRCCFGCSCRTAAAWPVTASGRAWTIGWSSRCRSRPAPARSCTWSDAVRRVDWPRTERYAEAVRAVHYASSRGEADFAQFTGEVARGAERVAPSKDPERRLAMAERRAHGAGRLAGRALRLPRRRSAADVSLLDEVISELRAAAGRTRSICLSRPRAAATERCCRRRAAELVEQLMAAARSPIRRPSGCRCCSGASRLIDRAVGLLPATWATRLRATALGGSRTSARRRAYTSCGPRRSTARQMREAADVRGLERLRKRVKAEAKLGAQRPADMAAVLATIDARRVGAPPAAGARSVAAASNRLSRYQRAVRPSSARSRDRAVRSRMARWRDRRPRLLGDAAPVPRRLRRWRGGKPPAELARPRALAARGSWPRTPCAAPARGEAADMELAQRGVRRGGRRADALAGRARTTSPWPPKPPAQP